MNYEQGRMRVQENGSCDCYLYNEKGECVGERTIYDDGDCEDNIYTAPISGIITYHGFIIGEVHMKYKHENPNSCDTLIDKWTEDICKYLQDCDENQLQLFYSEDKTNKMIFQQLNQPYFKYELA